MSKMGVFEDFGIKLKNAIGKETHKLFTERCDISIATLEIDSDNTFYDRYIIKGDNLSSVEIIGKVVCTLFSKVHRQFQPKQELTTEIH